jgi:hypothetical protein
MNKKYFKNINNLLKYNKILKQFTNNKNNLIIKLKLLLIL